MSDHLKLIEELYIAEKNKAINKIKKTYPESLWEREKNIWVKQNPDSINWLDNLTGEMFLKVTEFIKANCENNKKISHNDASTYNKSRIN